MGHWPTRRDGAVHDTRSRTTARYRATVTCTAASPLLAHPHDEGDLRRERSASRPCALVPEILFPALARERTSTRVTSKGETSPPRPCTRYHSDPGLSLHTHPPVREEQEARCHYNRPQASRKSRCACSKLQQRRGPMSPMQPSWQIQVYSTARPLPRTYIPRHRDRVDAPWICLELVCEPASLPRLQPCRTQNWWSLPPE